MTVSYSSDAYSADFGVYWRLLWRFHGSVWKLAYPEISVVIIVYSLLSLVYRLLLVDPYKLYFEMTVIGVARVIDQIPIGFVLGFYVSLIYGRFWKQFIGIPYTTKLAILFSVYIKGVDEQAVILRRTLIRYVAVAWAMAFRTMNIPIKKRFPTLRHFVDSGLLTEPEYDIIRKSPARKLDGCFFVPLTWCASLAERAHRTKQLCKVPLIDILHAIDEFRKSLQLQCTYDMVNVPLVYTQAIIFGVYSFLLAGTMAYQFIPMDRVKQLPAWYRPPSQFSGTDLYVPVFALVQLLVYAGLFKVAQSLLNPHGENDDDFEICNQIDKSLVNGYLIVTDLHNDLPELEPDVYWNTSEVNVPYTKAADEIRENRPDQNGHLGSLFHIPVKYGAEFLTQLSRQAGVSATAATITITAPETTGEPVAQAIENSGETDN